MRNLKKLLCLVLAVAMMASMFVVGASAAEKVYSETTKYSEAAAVITADAVKVMDGYEDGTMRYDAPVTREQAATIICKILLGTTAAENLKTGTAPFADVPATRWSAGYIAYLKSKGIVSGVTDTTFNPTAGVTGVQFAKMLLSAVGYGANKEFDGASWDINTISQANASGLFSDTKAADLTVGATREECMLYAFNTMTKIPVVKYNKTFDSYYTGTNALDPVTGTVNPAVDTPNTPYTFTLAYTNFKLKQNAGDGVDVYGRPSTNWVIGNAVVAENVANETPVAVLTGGVNSANLYPVLGATVIKDLKKNGVFDLKADGTADTKNGKYITVKVDGQTLPVAAWKEIKAGEAGVNAIARGGAVAEVYVDAKEAAGAFDHYEVTIIITYEHIATVSTVTKTAMSIRELGGSKKTYTIKAEDMNISGFAKNDVVKFNMGYDLKNTAAVVTDVEAATYVTGSYSGTNGMFQYIFVGKGYSTTIYSDVSALATVGDNYKLYTDSYGNLLYAAINEEAENVGSQNYVYLISAAGKGYSEDSFEKTDAKVAYTVVNTNGGKETLYAAVRQDKANATDETKGFGWYIADPDTPSTKIWVKDTSKGQNLVAPGWYSYTKNAEGNVTLKALNSKYAAKVTNATIDIVAGKNSIGGGISGIANSKTVLNVIDKNGNVVTYTGVNKFKTATYTSVTAMYTYDKVGGNLNTITIYTDAKPVAVVTNYAFCMMANGTGDQTYKYFFRMADGSVKEIELARSLDNGKNPLAADYDSGVGYIYDLTETNGEYEATKVAAYDDGVGVINGGQKTNGYGYMDLATYTWKYYEYATIDTVDDNFFTTVAIENRDTIVPPATEDGEATTIPGDYSDTIYGGELRANTVYFDGNTKIIDCTGAEVPATEVAPGNVFIAYIDKDASVGFNGMDYASYIWIIA